MLRSAVLRTKEMKRPNLRRLKPDRSITAGDSIQVYTKRRNEKAVYHVLRSDDEFDGLTDRHMQRIDLTLALGMLKLPHPLFTDNVDLERAGRRSCSAEIDL